MRRYLFIIFLIGLSQAGAQTPPKPAPLPLPPLPPATAQPAQLPPVPPSPQTAQPAQPLPKLPQAALPAAPAIPPELPVPDNSALIDTNEVPQPEVSLDLSPTTRDPFAKPQSLLKAETEVLKPVIDPSVYIDKRIEAIRRFPILNYTLVGIIFDVDNPKAIVRDPENNMHMITTNQRIGNQEGIITKIEKGELIVEEKGKVVTIKLLK